MTTSLSGQSAYVLHTRPFSESRFIVELFSANSGRVAALARRSKKSGGHRLLQPFSQLHVEWIGKSDLKTLTVTESVTFTPLAGKLAYCGLYINELLLRLLPCGEAVPNLYASYERSLQALSQCPDLRSSETPLRNFEFELLKVLGYGIDFERCAPEDTAILAHSYYQFRVEEGFMVCDQKASNAFSGAVIQSIGHRNFNDVDVLKSAKRLTRVAIDHLLGDRPLKSRELFL